MSKKLVFIAAFAIIVGAAIFIVAQSERGGRQRKARRGFVATRGTSFVVDGQPFRFIGANVAVMYKEEDRARMPETLQQAARDGLRVIRVWAFGEGGEDSPVKAIHDAADWPRKHPFRFAPGQWNEEAFVHLDRVIAEAARHNLRVQLCLTNYWRDTGGITQYLEWAGIKGAADDRLPYPGINDELAMLFYTNPETRRLYREHVEKIVTRRNTVTGVLYRDDPTIMAYELMNEAKAVTNHWHERRAWVAEMSAYIKSLDPDHLVTPGTWGYRTSWERREWLEEHRLPAIDFCDVHNYPSDDRDSFVDSPDALRQFIDNRMAAAYSINKPLVLGEFNVSEKGYERFSRQQWLRAYFESAARAGVGGAMFWILTPDPHRGYGIAYTTPRDEAVRAEIRRAADLMVSLQAEGPPRSLRSAGHHLVPRQFAFTRAGNDPVTRPEEKSLDDGGTLYLYKPEIATSARFEKMGGGEGYIWGAGVGHVDYVVPARDEWRRVKSVVVRAHIQPVSPTDARPSEIKTRVTLFINGVDCGSRLIPVETPKDALTQEWRVDSLSVLLQASRGKPLTIRFAVKADADKPFGINISNYPAEYPRHEDKPIQVEVK